MTSRNNRYNYYRTYANKEWMTTIDLSQTLDTESVVEYDAPNSVALIRIGNELLAGVSLTTGDNLYFNHLTRTNSKTIGVAFGHLWLVGFDENEQQWEIYAVESLSGSVTYRKVIEDPSIVDEETGTFCISENLETLFIVNKDVVTSYSCNPDGRKGKFVVAQLIFSQPGFPVTDNYRCAIQDENGMVFTGTENNEVVLVKVDLNGVRTWPKRSGNSLKEGASAEPSVTIGGVSYIPGFGRYFIVDTNGLVKTVDLNDPLSVALDKFVISQDDIAVTFNGQEFFGYKIKEKNFSSHIQFDGFIFHEESSLLVTFPKVDGKKGRFFSTDGSSNRFIPDSWLPLEFTDFLYETAFFPDMLFLMERRNEESLVVRGIPTKKSYFE